MSSSTAVRGYTQENRLRYPNCTRSSMYSANRPCNTHRLHVTRVTRVTRVTKELSRLNTHRENRKGALLPEFVLLRVVFVVCPVGGADEAVHQEGDHHLGHLVQELGHDQQRRQTLKTHGRGQHGI